MGRKRLEIARIEDKSARQVTFCKRRNGLLSKAKQLSILCDSDVGVIIYSSTGKCYNYCSNNNLPSIIRRYFNYVESESNSRSGEHGGQGDYSKYSEYITKDELLQVVERYLNDPDDDQRSIVELAFLESQIEIALMQTRRARTNVHLDIISALQDEGTTLEQQNNLLEHKLAKKKIVEEPTFDLNVVPDGYTTE